MTNINFVTSFNESLFVDTSYKFLESVIDKWEPKINLSKGIESTYQWYLENEV